MNFQERERVEYEHNILFEVVFQASFPEIMKISQEAPAEFQDIVRKKGDPELATSIAEDIETLQKVSQFNDGNVRANVVHVLSKEKMYLNCYVDHLLNSPLKMDGH